MNNRVAPLNHTGDLAHKIRSIANGADTLEVARFQFIGIDPIRAHYGGDWAEKKSRVQLVARHFIAKRTKPEDLIIPAADGFLLVFSSLSGTDAQVAAVEICNGLNQFFLGSPDDIDGIRFEHKSEEVSPDALIASVATGAELPTYRKKPAPEVAPNAALDSFHISYQPVWDARREKISTYFLTPIDPRTGLRAAGYQFEPEEPSPQELQVLDEAQLRESEHAIKRMLGAGKQAMIGVTISVNSLSNARGLNRLFSTISKFDPALARYRIVRIAGITPGYPRIYLEDIMRSLKMRVPNVSMSLHWSEGDLESVLALKPSAVGFTLNRHATGGIGEPADLRQRLKVASSKANAHRIPFYVHGDLTPIFAQQCVGDGISILSSSSIWARRDTPDGQKDWSLHRLRAAALDELVA